MESAIAPKLCHIHETFEYWTVSPSNTHPGSHVIAPNRTISHSMDLQPYERIELYRKIIPYLEVMIVAACGECWIHQRWQDEVYVLTPMTKDAMNNYLEHDLLKTSRTSKSSAA